MTKKLIFLAAAACGMSRTVQTADFFKKLFRSPSPVFVHPQVNDSFPVNVTVSEVLVPHPTDTFSPQSCLIVRSGPVYDAGHLKILVASLKERKLTRPAGSFIVSRQVLHNLVHVAEDITYFPIHVAVEEVIRSSEDHLLYPVLSKVIKTVQLHDLEELGGLIEEQGSYYEGKTILIKKSVISADGSVAHSSNNLRKGF